MEKVKFVVVFRDSTWLIWSHVW